METPSLSRRNALKVSLFGAAALALPFQGVLSASSASRIASSKLPRPYTLPFRKPPVLATTPTSDPTTDYYVVRQQAFVGEILPGVKTPLFGYNGTVPGPTIKATKGRRTVVRQINDLPEVHPALGYVPWTSTHLHGIAVGAAVRRLRRRQLTSPGVEGLRVPEQLRGRGPSGTTTTACTTPPRTSTWAWPPSTTSPTTVEPA
jgi:FtsP/CotA-like multicopper oxidase with cupredoxin domain